MRARECDPISAFGGIIAVQGKVGRILAQSISENFAEIILAHGYTWEALKILGPKKNLRLLRFSQAFLNLRGGEGEGTEEMELRNAMNGLLYQQKDVFSDKAEKWRIVSKKKADTDLLCGMEFAWSVAKQVKSNAVVFCSPHTTLGIGAGQMSRIDSVEIAVSKARKAKKSLQGSIAASDGFFPFRDGIDALAEAGAKAVVHPGGSLRDEEIIAAADEHGIAMAFTGTRHFLH